MFKISIKKKRVKRRFLPPVKVGKFLEKKVEYISYSAFLKDDGNGDYLRWIYDQNIGYCKDPIRITEHQYKRAINIIGGTWYV